MVLGPPADEVVLEVENALIRTDLRAQTVISHGDDAGWDEEGARDLGCCLGKRAAAAEQIGARDAGGEIAVAEAEPGVVAEAGDGIEDVVGVALESKALLFVG